MKKWLGLLTSALLLFSVSVYAEGYRRGSGFNNGVLEMSDYPILFDEAEDDPGIPASDSLQLYAKDKAGTTTLYTQDASGTVKELGEPDLSAYLTTSTAASTYAPITEPLSLHLAGDNQTVTQIPTFSGLNLDNASNASKLNVRLYAYDPSPLYSGITAWVDAGFFRAGTHIGSDGLNAIAVDSGGNFTSFDSDLNIGVRNGYDVGGLITIGAPSSVAKDSRLILGTDVVKISALTSNGFLKTGSSDGTLSVDTNTYLTSVTAHNLLSTTHGDTTAGSVARGSIITGQGETPKWTALALPATPTGKILTATATDVSWSSNPLTIGTNASVSGSNTGDQDLSSYIKKDGSVDFTGEPSFKAIFTAGENLVAGNVCYLKSDGKYWKAKGNAEATTKGRIAMALASISAGATGSFLVRGYYTDSGLTAGATYFISTSTAGAKVTTAPTSGNFARVVGWAMSTTSFYFDPSKDYIEVS